MEDIELKVEADEEVKEVVETKEEGGNTYVWSSCLGCTTDSRLLKYLTKMILIGVVIVFCCIQLARVDTCSSQKMYISLLTFSIGLIFPKSV